VRAPFVGLEPSGMQQSGIGNGIGISFRYWLKALVSNADLLWMPPLRE